MKARKARKKLKARTKEGHVDTQAREHVTQVSTRDTNGTKACEVRNLAHSYFTLQNTFRRMSSNVNTKIMDWCKLYSRLKNIVTFVNFTIFAIDGTFV